MSPKRAPRKLVGFGEYGKKRKQRKRKTRKKKTTKKEKK